MEKNKTMLKIVLLLISMLITTTDCKGHKEKAESATQTEKENIVFSQVLFSKISDYQNPQIKSLEINYDKFTYFLKFVEDRTYLRYLVNGKLISDWKQISYNFNYNSSYEEAETKISILYNSNTDSGFLILPGYTEEYPVFNEYLFNSSEIRYSENLSTTDFKCLKSAGNKFVAVQQRKNVEFRVNDCILKKEIVDNLVDSFTSADLEKISKDDIVRNNNNSSPIDENLASSKISDNNIDDFIPLGMFTINTTVESITSEKEIRLKFNFYFQNEQEMNLKISTDNYEEAYCEGKYKLVKNKNIIEVKYDDEGICTDNVEESNFYIKKENSKILIKSKRFINQNWQELTKV